MVAYYNEIDPFAAQWLRTLITQGHLPRGDVDERSIEDVKPDDLRTYTQCHFFAGIGVWAYALRLAGWDDDSPVWTGSCPCQPFSAAGKAAGFDDERHLWPAWFHLIEHAKPRSVPVFGEQVASKDGLAWLDLVHADMEGAGHTVRAIDFCAAGIGAPHIRQRLWFVADPASKRYDGRRTSQTCPKSGAQQRPERLCHVNGMADSSSARPLPSTQRSICGGEKGRGTWNAEPERSCDARGLADTKSGGFGELRSASGKSGQPDISDGIGIVGNAFGSGLEGQCGHGDKGDEPGRIGETAHGYASETSATGGMADADDAKRRTDDTRRDDSDRQATGRQQGHSHSSEHIVSGILAYADGGNSGTAGVQRGGEYGQRQEDSGVVRSRNRGIGHNSDGELVGTRPTNGHWRDTDWLYCRDGKWRPVEPGTFPLAHGATARMGRLRGYGNAINAEAAKAFIEAYDGIAV